MFIISGRREVREAQTEGCITIHTDVGVAIEQIWLMPPMGSSTGLHPGLSGEKAQWLSDPFPTDSWVKMRICSLGILTSFLAHLGEKCFFSSALESVSLAYHSASRACFLDHRCTADFAVPTCQPRRADRRGES